MRQTTMKDLATTDHGAVRATPHAMEVCAVHVRSIHDIHDLELLATMRGYTVGFDTDGYDDAAFGGRLYLASDDHGPMPVPRGSWVVPCGTRLRLAVFDAATFHGLFEVNGPWARPD